jgi:hypothetical protein
MHVGRLLGWVMALTLAGLVAGQGCGTEPIAVDGCRKIEEARCELAPRCPNLKVPDVDACKRFYRDQCLHGLSTASDPGAPAIDRCVEALKVAAQCTAADNGCVQPASSSTPVTSGCQILERPELALDCAFLSAPASTGAAGGPTLVAGNGGAAGEAGAAGASAGAGGAGM